MAFEKIQTVAAMAGLAIFIPLFAAFLVYAVWPGNRDKFDRAARAPLDDGERPE